LQLAWPIEHAEAPKDDEHACGGDVHVRSGNARYVQTFSV
jgi:hypothetical protein